MSPTDSRENAWWRRWSLILAASLALIVVTRWPLVPTRHLYHIDNVNFALALDDFDPARDQPQPPGDPLYVALTRWMRPFVPSAELLFPVSGVIGSAAALAALWWVGEIMFGARAGVLAALLLALNPIFWLAGVGNYVRVYLALGAAVVAGLAWKSMTWKSMRTDSVNASAVYFCASAAALGFFAGFRPEMGLLLAPLVLIPAWRRRAPWWHWLAAAVCVAATTLPWLAITAQHSGGLARLYRLNRAYLSTQARHSSWFYGATLSEAIRMAAASVYWNFLGAVPWIAFVPRVWSQLRERRAALFLALWFVPPFLFYTFIHIHNPDHALVAIPAVCLTGAWVLTRLPASWFCWAVPAALAANVALFFYPTEAPFRASNYRIAEFTMRSAEQVYARVGLLEKLGPLTVLVHGSYITPQEIGYYFPRVAVLSVGSGPARVRLENRTMTVPAENGEVRIAAGRVLWLDPVTAVEAGYFDGLRAAVGGESGSEGAVHWANLPIGVRFRVGQDPTDYQWIRAVSGNDTMSSMRP